MSVATPLAPAAVACPACGFGLAPETIRRENEIACPHCHALVSGEFFPVFWWPPAAGSGLADRADDGDAVCFFHPENRAALSCDRCGRFVCTVCDMPLGARHLCPTCLSSGLGAEKLPELIVRRFHWSNSALLAGLLPLVAFFIWPVFVVTGPLAIFCALFGWKRPGSLPRGRRRWVAVIGLVLGVVQLAVWIGLLGMFANLFANSNSSE